jgi:hypothetical protein
LTWTGRSRRTRNGSRGAFTGKFRPDRVSAKAFEPKGNAVTTKR